MADLEGSLEAVGVGGDEVVEAVSHFGFAKVEGMVSAEFRQERIAVHRFMVASPQSGRLDALARVRTPRRFVMLFSWLASIAPA